MLQFHSRLIPGPIRCQEDNELCAIAREMIVDFSSGSVVGLQALLPGFFPRKSIALMQDITSWDDPITINSHESLTDGSDIVRLEPVLATRHILIKLPVRSEQGETLGVVLDFIFDDTSGSIMKYFVGRARLFSVPEATYCITRDDVISITPDAMIVKDRLRPIAETEIAINPDFTPEPAA